MTETPNPQTVAEQALVRSQVEENEENPSLILAWEEPIEAAKKPTKADQLMLQLRAHPDRWALVDTYDGMILFPWWNPLRSDPEFQVKTITERPPNGPLPTSTRVYARYRTETSDD